ncbi:MAG TPA: hypothetical protein VLD62_03705 [Acidimicrobiia bacterium]|nr:hypothetical protein [Acidimicrobiia bacterium]
MRRFLVLAVLLTACGLPMDRALDGTRPLDISICDPATGSFSADITNPYLPLAPGRAWVLTGGSMRVEIAALDETEVVAGIETRVFEEREAKDGELFEISRNFVAQAADGTVCYFGEDVEDYEDGELVGSSGAWRAGIDEAVPGILMPADPQAGTSYRQEVAPGVAEDAALVLALGGTADLPAGVFTDVLTVMDVDPIGGGADGKRYARDVGPLTDGGLRLESWTG